MRRGGIPADATATIHGAFDEQALRCPESPALLHCGAYGPPGVLFTYAELRRAVGALAAALRAAAASDAPLSGTGDSDGAVSGVRQCAFLLGSSPARIVGYFACLAAKLAYTPLETSHPPAVLVRDAVLLDGFSRRLLRIIQPSCNLPTQATLLSHARPALVVTSEELRHKAREILFCVLSTLFGSSADWVGFQ